MPLAGRIANFLSNWEDITQDEWVLHTIMGFQIEFLQKPKQTSKPPGRGMHAGRDPKHAEQTGHLRDSEQPRGLLLSDVSCFKEGWQTCNKLEETKPVRED